MNIIATIIAALVGTLGIMIGAALQYFFGKRVEASKQYQSLKSQAYVDFIKAVAGIAIAQKRQNTEKEFEFSILLADAKVRIAIYGNKEVVEKMANFFRNHGTLTSPESMSSFIEIAQTMRQQTIGRNELGIESAIKPLLFS